MFMISWVLLFLFAWLLVRELPSSEEKYKTKMRFESRLWYFLTIDLLQRETLNPLNIFLWQETFRFPSTSITAQHLELSITMSRQVFVQSTSNSSKKYSKRNRSRLMTTLCTWWHTQVWETSWLHIQENRAKNSSYNPWSCLPGLPSD